MPSKIPYHRPAAADLARRTGRREYDARRPESDRLYHTARWQKVAALKRSASPLCERCQAAGLVVVAEIVHHKQHVTVHGPEDFFNLDNLESLCRSCHAREHGGKPRGSANA